MGNVECKSVGEWGGGGGAGVSDSLARACVPKYRPLRKHAESRIDKQRSEGVPVLGQGRACARRGVPKECT